MPGFQLSPSAFGGGLNSLNTLLGNNFQGQQLLQQLQAAKQQQAAQQQQMQINKLNALSQLIPEAYRYQFLQQNFPNIQGMLNGTAQFGQGIPGQMGGAPQGGVAQPGQAQGGVGGLQLPNAGSIPTLGQLAQQINPQLAPYLPPALANQPYDPMQASSAVNEVQKEFDSIQKDMGTKIGNAGTYGKFAQINPSLVPQAAAMSGWKPVDSKSYKPQWNEEVVTDDKGNAYAVPLSSDGFLQEHPDMEQPIVDYATARASNDMKGMVAASKKFKYGLTPQSAVQVFNESKTTEGAASKQSSLATAAANRSLIPRKITIQNQNIDLNAQRHDINEQRKTLNALTMTSKEYDIAHKKLSNEQLQARIDALATTMSKTDGERYREIGRKSAALNTERSAQETKLQDAQAASYADDVAIQLLPLKEKDPKAIGLARDKAKNDNLAEAIQKRLKVIDGKQTDFNNASQGLEKKYQKAEAGGTSTGTGKYQNAATAVQKINAIPGFHAVDEYNGTSTYKNGNNIHVDFPKGMTYEQALASVRAIVPDAQSDLSKGSAQTTGGKHQDPGHRAGTAFDFTAPSLEAKGISENSTQPSLADLASKHGLTK